MNKEERRQYKAQKAKEYRAKDKKTVDNSRGQSENVDNIVDNPAQLRGQIPHGVDKEVWREAEDRAERARRYASKMPQHIRPGEEVFQTVEWQYTQLQRYPLPLTHEV